MPFLLKSHSCPCDDIRQWGKRVHSKVYWKNVSRHAQLLRNNRQKRWRMTTKQLLDSVQSGCQTCSLFRDAIVSFGADLASLPGIEILLGNLTPQLKITVQRDPAKVEQGFWLTHPHGYQGHEPFGPGVIKFPQQPRPAPLEINLDEKVDMIRGWVRGCFQYHGSCEKQGSVPRRLLNVGSGTADLSEDSIRLLEMGTTLSEPYVALSHCWGKTKQAVTTKANFQARLSSISLQELSRTFQDAVWLTRRLGIRFIWIDSLCIIQDDADDWDREAVKMAQLYSSAYITIAASFGVDGRAGMFSQSSLRSHKQLGINIPDLKGDIQNVIFSMIPWDDPEKESPAHDMYGAAPNGDSRAKDSESLNYERDILLSRGWAFQERVLSTRIIHFTRSEMVWECRRVRGCECGHIRGDTLINSFVGLPQKGSEHGGHDEEDDDSWSGSDVDMSDTSWERRNEPFTSYQNDEKPDKTWESIVSLYTTRELTKAEDRGPAFAGIAQSFSTYLSAFEEEYLVEYCAGTWREYLPWSLLWTCSSNGLLPPFTGTSQRMKNCMAPSWSWYSVTGPCRFDVDARPVLRLARYTDEDVDVTYDFDAATGSPFGRLRRGALTIQGMCIAQVTRSSDSLSFSPKGPSYGSPSSIGIQLLSDDPKDAKHVGDMACLYMYNGTHDLFLWDRNRRDPPPWHLNDDNEFVEEHDNNVQHDQHKKPHPDFLAREELYKELDLLPIPREYVDPFQEKDYEDPYDKYHPNTFTCEEHFVGLALLPVPNEEDTYRRIGLFHAQGTGCPGLEGLTTPHHSSFDQDELYQDELFQSTAGVDWHRSLDIKDKIVLT